MDGETAAWVLALPLDVRLKLAKVGGPGWSIWVASTGPLSSGPFPVELDVPHWSVYAQSLMGFVRDSPTVTAWLPCDPTAILRHAARLLGAPVIDVQLRQAYDGPWRAYVQAGGRNAEADGACPHRAAIAVLAKVMEVGRG